MRPVQHFVLEQRLVECHVRFDREALYAAWRRVMPTLSGKAHK